MKKDTETDDGYGFVSSMRVTLKWARAVGSILVLAGIATVAVSMAFRIDAALSVGLGLAGLGAGLPAAVAGCKAWQSQAESSEREGDK